MRAVIIADAHIKGTDDPAQSSLAAFLATVASGEDTRPEYLIILGDLFDFWAGVNPIVYNRYLPLLSALKEVSESRIKIIYLEGNHDFNMGRFFTEELGADVYPRHCELSLDGTRTYLAHGDAVDKSLDYSLWRWFVRSPFMRALIWALPSFVSMGIADLISKRSRGKAAERGRAIEVRLKAFARRRIALGFGAVCMAHSHLPASEELDCDGTSGVYANPGDWAEDASYLLYEDNTFTVKYFEPDKFLSPDKSLETNDTYSESPDKYSESKGKTHAQKAR